MHGLAGARFCCLWDAAAPSPRADTPRLMLFAMHSVRVSGEKKYGGFLRIGTIDIEKEHVHGAGKKSQDWHSGWAFGDVSLLLGRKG